MSTPNRIGIRSYQTNAIIFLLAFILYGTLNAQILELSEGEVLQKEPFFKQKWIKENRISTIRTQVSVKDDGLPIQQRRTQVTYRFHRDGLFRSMYKTIDKGNWIDSASVAIKYNSRNQVVFKRERDLFGVHLYSYEYRSDGSLFREVYSRPASYKQKPRSVYFENIVFESGVVKRNHKNANDRIFKVELFHYDSQGNLTSYRDKRHISGINTEKQLIYSKTGTLDSIEIKTLQPQKSNLTFTYKYDDFGVLISYNSYKNGVFIAHNELLYKNELVDAILSKDEETHRITITRFTYEFF